jgi:hypothetical protein
MNKLFQIMLVDKVKGKRKSVVVMYVVMATSREDALSKFNEELPAQIADETQVTVLEYPCNVVRMC